ncbi:MAG: hypothetical protein ABJA49_03895 [Betaproteobacteria bacterium]
MTFGLAVGHTPNGGFRPSSASAHSVRLAAGVGVLITLLLTRSSDR